MEFSSLDLGNMDEFPHMYKPMSSNKNTNSYSYTAQKYTSFSPKATTSPATYKDNVPQRINEQRISDTLNSFLNEFRNLLSP